VGFRRGRVGGVVGTTGDSGDIPIVELALEIDAVEHGWTWMDVEAGGEWGGKFFLGVERGLVLHLSLRVSNTRNMTDFLNHSLGQFPMTE